MNYDMVFEGGGAKGMVFVGALQEVEARGHSPSRLIGASAGAIMATFLAAGYSSQEMAAALSERQNGQPVFLGFLEAPAKLTPAQIQSGAIRDLLRAYNSKLIPDIVEEAVDDAIANIITTSETAGRICSFIELGGFYAARIFLEWMETKLNTGVYLPDRGNFPKGNNRAFGSMNLAQYYDATGADLSLIGSDTTDARILVLNHLTAPDCPLTWAVRMSMSFPLLWEEVVWQPGWGRYMGKDISGHTVVDGGMLSNFPIELFISDEEYTLQFMGEKKVNSNAILGFLIDESIDVPNTQPAAAEPVRFGIGQLKTVQRVMKLINTMTQAHDKKVIEAYERYVIRLPAKGYGTIEFGMSEERREALVEAGRKATQEYFNRVEEMEGSSRGLEGPAVEPEPPREVADRIAMRILTP